MPETFLTPFNQAGLVGHFTVPPPGTNLSTVVLTQRNKQGGDVLITFAILHVFSFSMFWGPAPWVYLGESFPLRVRPKGIALGSAMSKWHRGICELAAASHLTY